MKALFLVGVGGGLGAVARYLLGGWATGRTPDWTFPLGTCVVNVVGCLIAGVLAGLAVRRGWFAGDARLFVFTGLLGGFTTFSAFGLETVTLLRKGEAGVAALYVGASVIGGLAALAAGMGLTAR